MQTTLLTAGIACIIAAIVGGGLAAFSFTIPVLKSRTEQVGLALVGLVMVIAAFQIARPSTEPAAPEPISQTEPKPQPGPQPTQPTINRAALESELNENRQTIDTLNSDIISGEQAIAAQQSRIVELQNDIKELQGELDAGEGDADARTRASDAIERTKAGVIAAQSVIAGTQAAETNARNRIQELQTRDGVIQSKLDD